MQTRSLRGTVRHDGGLHRLASPLTAGAVEVESVSRADKFVGLAFDPGDERFRRACGQELLAGVVLPGPGHAVAFA
jgi:hypothetical protein